MLTIKSGIRSGKNKCLSSQNQGTKGIELPWYHPASQQQLRTRFPITEDDPAAHFLAAAPGRTPQRLTNRLPADGRSSLGKAFPAELPVQRIYLPYLYHSREKLARGNLSAAGRKRRKTGGGTAVPPPTGSVWRSAPEGLHQLRVGIVTDVDAPGDILQTDIPPHRGCGRPRPPPPARCGHWYR